MSDYTYIKLTKQDGTPCIVASAASYLTLALPSLGNAYQDTTLHLQIRWSSDNVADPLGTTNVLDTGATDVNLNKVILFTGSTWISMPEHGFAQSLAGCRVLVDTKGINPDSFLYYSWYYVADGISVHVTPWVSTKLTATAGIPKHSELQDRNSTDQHTISAITGLSEALSKDYHEARVYTDNEMTDMPLPGRVITFVGYSNGTSTGAVVMRYKTYNGTYGNLTPGITATLEDDNLVIEDEVTAGEGGGNVIVDVVDNVLYLTSSNINVEDNIVNITSEEPSLSDVTIA